MSALYDWFEKALVTEGGEIAKAMACAALANHVGMLNGMGVPREEIVAFVVRLARDNERVLSRVSEDKTFGENVDAIFSGARFEVLDGGKKGRSES